MSGSVLHWTAMVPLLFVAASAAAQSANGAPADASKPAEKSERATWITLGTGGGPQIRQKRSQPANALLVNGAVYLFDMGAGTLHRFIAAGLRLNQLRAAFLSHHHIDHNAGIAPVLMHRWQQAPKAPPLIVLGPPGSKAMVDGILTGNRSTELSPVTQEGRQKPELASSSVGTDLPLATPEPIEIYRDENVRILAIVNTHYNFPAGSEPARVSRSYAFRAETSDRSFVYTGDTGPSEAVTRLANGADVLVAEVMDPAAMQRVAERNELVSPEAFMRHMLEDHLTPEEVGKLAAAANVQEVVLTHIVPGFDRETSTAAYSEGVREYFTGKITVADDLERF